MKPHLLVRPFLAAFAICFAAMHAKAQLASKSPFLSAEADAPSRATPAEPLEFQGFVENNDGLRFRVRDTAHNAAAWVRLKERDPDLNLVVNAHDPSRETLTVEQQGRSVVLPQKQSKVVSSGVAVPVPRLQPVAIAPPPSASQQQRQLEELAATLAQRRAARAQAAPVPPPTRKSQ